MMPTSGNATLVEAIWTLCGLIYCIFSFRYWWATVQDVHYLDALGMNGIVKFSARSASVIAGFALLVQMLLTSMGVLALTQPPLSRPEIYTWHSLTNIGILLVVQTILGAISIYTNHAYNRQLRFLSTTNQQGVVGLIQDRRERNHG
jgi:hypothetical protein